MNEKELPGNSRPYPTARAVTCCESCWPTPAVRTDLIRQFYERDETQNLAQVLMDLESDDVLRLTVIGLLDKLNDAP